MQFCLSFLLHGTGGRSITPTRSDADEMVLMTGWAGTNDNMPPVFFAFAVFKHPSKIISLPF